MTYDRLIIGCGYLGLRAARLWQKAGLRVAATTRSTERAAAFKQEGLDPIVCNVLDAQSLTALPAANCVLYAVGLDRQAGDSMRDVYVNGLQNVLDVLEGKMDRLLYVSSTSVYGQTDGSWVDETSDCEPTRENGQICLEAEQAITNADVSSVILRMGGLYGPDRLLARIREREQGIKVAGNPEAWLNLIHIDDAVAAVDTVASSQDGPPKYLVIDDQPIQRKTYYETLARLLELPPPEFNPDTPDRKGDRGLNKRCSNRLIRETLGLEWTYPTIEEGLPAAL